MVECSSFRDHLILPGQVHVEDSVPGLCLSPVNLVARTDDPGMETGVELPRSPFEYRFEELSAWRNLDQSEFCLS